MGAYAIVIVLMIVVFIFSIWCQFNVSGTFKKYNKQRTEKGNTAEFVARTILDENGLHNVPVQRTSGHLTDHYDPRNNTVYLSDSVFNSSAIAAIGVAAHECGHAIQHNSSYAPIKLRTALVPVVNIANHAWFLLFLIGMLMQMAGLIQLGIILFACITAFQLVTLPVELDASARAIRIIDREGLVTPEEVPQARKVLTAAAMTYVAALAMSILQLLRLILATRRD